MLSEYSTHHDQTGAGEMLCRSRAVCMGYLHSEEKTRDTIDDEGWLHSGDLVRADQEGFYKVEFLNFDINTSEKPLQQDLCICTLNESYKSGFPEVLM